MINFKDPKDQTPSALAVLGMVLIGGAVIVSLFFNRGIDARGYATKAKKDQLALAQRTQMAQSDRSIFEYAIERFQWSEIEDVVTPQALDIVSKRSEENHLKLVNFRPLKSIETSSIVQLPMQFTVDGSFANVASMLESLEKPGSKLAVQQVQFASQEGQSDLVSANVSLLAFLAKPVAPKSTSKTSPLTSASSATPSSTASAGASTSKK